MNTQIRSAVFLLLVFIAGLTPGRAPSQLSAQQAWVSQVAEQVPARPPASALPPSPAQQQPPAQQPPAQPAAGQPPPVFRAGVNFVRVDVIVSDREGNPITDLKIEDFEVVEDNKSQTIDLFKLVNTDGTVQPGAEPARPIRSRYDEEMEAARDDVRLFVIFLDDYHVRMGSGMRVREPLSKFVSTQLGPLDMVAIMYPLTPVSALTFTRDHSSVMAAIRKFEGRKYDYRPRNAVEEKYAYYPAQTIETIRNQVTISALEGVAVRLGSMREGRKAVIFVSEGFTSLLPPQMRDPNSQMPGLGNPSAGNPFAGNSQTEDRARFSSDVDLQRMMRDIYDAANRNNTAFYAIDPRGLATGEFDVSENINFRVDSEVLRQSQDTLRVLASETDGRAIVNQNDLDRGLRQIVRDTSSYYLVGYTSSAKTDGKFHKIDVRVKRPGAGVRARKGYWAATSADAEAAAAPPRPRPAEGVERALGVMDGRPRDSLVAIWFQMSPGSDGRTRVTLVWEALPVAAGLSREVPVALQVSASLLKGALSFRGRVPEEGPAAAEGTPGVRPSVMGVPSRPHRIAFDSEPGRLQVRLAVENAKGQVVDTSVQEVTVPDLTETAVRLTTPAVYRARTPREYQALTRDPDPVPTALREFRRTDRVIVRFEATAPGTAVPDVTARLLNRTGQPMSALPVTVPPPGGATFYQVDLPLVSVAAGDYLVEVTAKTSEGSVVELVAVRVTS